MKKLPQPDLFPVSDEFFQLNKTSQKKGNEIPKEAVHRMTSRYFPRVSLALWQHYFPVRTTSAANRHGFFSQALIDENIDPDDHIFTLEPASPKKRLNSSQKSDATNGDESFILDASGDDGLDTDDLVVKDDADDDDEIVDEVGEIDKESFADELMHEEEEAAEKNNGDDVEGDGDAQRLVNDANNGENEDSLNLTIGEDEAKIFQDEVSRGGLLTQFFCDNFVFLLQDTEEKSKEKSGKFC